MNPFSYATSARSARLRLRSQQQREQLLAHLSDIESRLQRADDKVAAIRRFVTKPAVIAGGTVLTLLLRRAGGKWRWLGRGLILTTAVKRVFEALRHR